MLWISVAREPAFIEPAVAVPLGSRPQLRFGWVSPSQSRSRLGSHSKTKPGAGGGPQRSKAQGGKEGSPRRHRDRLGR